IAHPEVRDRSVLRVAGHDLAGQLVALAGLGRAEQLARAAGLARGREARVHEGGGEQHGGAQRDDEPDRALTGGIHRLRLWRGRYATRVVSQFVDFGAYLDEWRVPSAEGHIKVWH